MSKFFHWIRYKKYILLVIILFFPTCEEEDFVNETNIPKKYLDSNFVYNQNSQIDKNDWKLIEFVNDTNDGLQVQYREKYGSEIIVYCRVIFYNEKTHTYKLISPFLNAEVNKDNVYNFQIQEVMDWYRK